MKKNTAFGWALAKNGRIVRDRRGRRAIYRTRREAREARWYGGAPSDARVVRRNALSAAR